MPEEIQLSDSNSMHLQIEEDRKKAFPEAPLIAVFRRYVRGRQNATYTPNQQIILRGVNGNRKADNLCNKVVTETSNRLKLLRFNVAVESVRKFLDELYTKNQLAKLAKDVHLATVRDGNFCLSLNYDVEASRVTIHKEKWYDGKSGIFVGYGDNGQPAYAFKDWKTSRGKERRIIWWPDKIERYIRDGDGWKPFILDEDQGQWPVPWVRPDGTPLGLPIIHFANGSDDDSFYGASLLDGGVLGMQDDVNDAQVNITSSARLTGAQMLFFFGIGPDLDEATGQPKPMRVGPGAVFTSENPDAKAGAIPAGDLSQLKEAYQIKIQALARMTNTPMYLITGGDWPSGEALLQANQPLIEQVEALAESIGPAWATVAHRATELANVFGKAGLDEDAFIQAVFQPVNTRDPLTQSTIATAIAPFVSKKEVLRVLGYSPQQSDQILAELKEEGTQAHLLSVADITPALPPGREQ